MSRVPVSLDEGVHRQKSISRDQEGPQMRAEIVPTTHQVDRRNLLRTGLLVGLGIGVVGAASPLLTGRALAEPAAAAASGDQQSGWKWCVKCQGLFYGVDSAHVSASKCPAGSATPQAEAEPTSCSSWEASYFWATPSQAGSGALDARACSTGLIRLTCRQASALQAAPTQMEPPITSCSPQVDNLARRAGSIAPSARARFSELTRLMYWQVSARPAAPTPPTTAGRTLSKRPS